MNLSVHVERLTIEGVPVPDSDLLQTAVRAELTRLLSESGLPTELLRGGTWISIHAPTLRFSSFAHAEEAGAGIGASIYGALVGSTNGTVGGG